MPANEELSDKIDAVKRKLPTVPSLFVQYWVSPLLLLVIGFFVIREVQQTEEAFRQLELDVRKIEAAQDTFAELLPSILESAVVADRVKNRAFADNPAKESPKTPTARDPRQQKRQLLEKGPADMKGIAAAAETTDGRPAAEAGSVKSDEKRYYIVVASAAAENRDNAVKRAEELRVKGYRSAVRDTESGSLVVTLGPVPKDEAELVLADAVLRRDVMGDSFLSEGKTFKKQIFP